MPPPLGLAIIGAGKAGTNAAHAFGACGGASVARIVSRTAASAARLASALGGVPYGTDLSEALADPAVEAVFVATPDALHCDQTIAAARAGRHVLCEKPMCRSVTEAKAMIQACDQDPSLLHRAPERRPLGLP